MRELAASIVISVVFWLVATDVTRGLSVRAIAADMALCLAATIITLATTLGQPGWQARFAAGAIIAAALGLALFPR
jgi:hypothetical protein